MPLVVAVWPNNTITVLGMRKGYKMVDVFDALDAEDDPVEAKCYEVRKRARDRKMPLAVSFNYWKKKLSLGVDGKGDGTITSPYRNLAISEGAGGTARIKRLHWPPDIVEQAHERFLNGWITLESPAEGSCE